MLFVVYKHRKKSNYTGPIGMIIASDLDSAARALNSEVTSDFWHFRAGLTNDLVLHYWNDENSRRYVIKRTR